MSENLINYLNSFVTDQRAQLFNDVIKDRTRYITVVLEDINHPYNASAILRTCDCFGIQDVHIIENENKYEVNPFVALGANRWIDINKYNKSENNTLETIEKLKKENYRIVATTPHINDVSLDEFDITKGKTALFFGTELHGLSKTVIDNADDFIKIPMFGFTESFNISVSAAIILYQLVQKVRKSPINWQLSTDEQNQIRLNWLKLSIKKSDLIVDEYFKRKIENII